MAVLQLSFFPRSTIKPSYPSPIGQRLTLNASYVIETCVFPPSFSCTSDFFFFKSLVYFTSPNVFFIYYFL